MGHTNGFERNGRRAVSWCVRFVSDEKWKLSRLKTFLCLLFAVEIVDVFFHLFVWMDQRVVCVFSVCEKRVTCRRKWVEWRTSRRLNFHCNRLRWFNEEELKSLTGNGPSVGRRSRNCPPEINGSPSESESGRCRRSNWPGKNSQLFPCSPSALGSEKEKFKRKWKPNRKSFLLEIMNSFLCRSSRKCNEFSLIRHWNFDFFF